MTNPYEPPHILGVPSQSPTVLLNITRKPLFFPESEAKGYILEDAGGLVANKEVLYLFEEIVESPTVVFDQFDRDFGYQRFCYCGIPGSVVANGTLKSPNVREVGLVFALFDVKSSMIVVNRITWSLMSNQLHGYPQNWESLGTKKWPV